MKLLMTNSRSYKSAGNFAIYKEGGEGNGNVHLYNGGYVNNNIYKYNCRRVFNGEDGRVSLGESKATINKFV